MRAIPLGGVQARAPKFRGSPALAGNLLKAIGGARVPSRVLVARASSTASQSIPRLGVPMPRRSDPTQKQKLEPMHILKSSLLAGAAALGLFATSVHAQDTVKVGVLHSLSGT